MSKSEYVKLSGSENYYGEKNLLETQLRVLNITQGFKSYKKLRTEELKHKVELRAKMAEMNELLKKLDKQLPTTEYNPRVQRKLAERKKKINLSLQEEIKQIQEKLNALQSG